MRTEKITGICQERDRVGYTEIEQMESVRLWKNGKEVENCLLRRCKAAVRRIVRDADVVLYGSRARGDAGEDSDYDIVVVVRGAVDMALEDRIRSEVYPLELETGAVITLMVYSRDDWDSPLSRAMPFRRNVEREGVLL